MFFRKDVNEGDGVSTALADALSTPAPNEAQLLDAVEKNGGDESVAEAAATLARTAAAITDAFDGKLPAEVAKAMRAASGIPESVKKAAPKPAPVATKPKPAAESVRELEKLEKAVEVKLDRRAEETINSRAENVRKASGYKLSKAESVVQVLKADPSLYASYERDQWRRAGFLNDGPATIHKAADAQARIDRAVDAELAKNPGLTRLEALTKAFKEDPSLAA